MILRFCSAPGCSAANAAATGINKIKISQNFFTVPFRDEPTAITVATDGPEMMRTHLRDEFELLLRIGAIGREEATAANERGHAAAFRGLRPAVAAG